VSLDASGDRSFSFYRNPGADTGLSAGELDLSIISASRIFHFGSLSLTDEPARSATFAALDHAKQEHKTISYDPNLRPLLWKSLDDAKEKILSAIGYAGILKISEEEMEFLTGETDLTRGTGLIQKRYNTPLILVTRGADGCFYRTKDFSGNTPAFTGLDIVDTTGAGDSFLGAFLYGRFRGEFYDPCALSADDLAAITVFSCAAAGLCSTKKALYRLCRLSLKSKIFLQEKNRHEKYHHNGNSPQRRENGPTVFHQLRHCENEKEQRARSLSILRALIGMSDCVIDVQSELLSAQPGQRESVTLAFRDSLEKEKITHEYVKFLTESSGSFLSKLLMFGKSNKITAHRVLAQFDVRTLERREIADALPYFGMKIFVLRNKSDAPELIRTLLKPETFDDDYTKYAHMIVFDCSQYGMAGVFHSDRSIAELKSLFSSI
jgi:hypothetical protein